MVYTKSSSGLGNTGDNTRFSFSNIRRNSESTKQKRGMLVPTPPHLDWSLKGSTACPGGGGRGWRLHLWRSLFNSRFFCINVFFFKYLVPFLHVYWVLRGALSLPKTFSVWIGNPTLKSTNSTEITNLYHDLHTASTAQNFSMSLCLTLASRLPTSRRYTVPR